MLFRDLSVVISLFHVLILFLFLYGSRFSRRKTAVLVCTFMVPLLLLNTVLFIRLGPERYLQNIIAFCTIPSFLFLFFTARNRDGRFLFTFCFCDTIALEIICITKILDFYLPGDRCLFMFFSRFFAFPLIEYLTFRYVRKPYARLQEAVKIGWGAFSFVTILFYMSLVLEASVPTLITDRSQYLPHMLIILILIPAAYITIFLVFYEQSRRFEAEEYSNTLLMQTHMMIQRLSDKEHNENRLRIQKHDMRHRLNTVSSMIRARDYDGALRLIDGSLNELEGIRPAFYCPDPILNSMFAYYFQKAATAGIRLVQNISLPDALPIDAVELSTVFANAIENAVNACLELPAHKREIRCKCISYPNLMFSISNPYSGTVALDSDGIPISDSPEHGIGTRSIRAFCSKHSALCEYKVTDKTVTLRIAMQIL